jgi:hypothetical protein
MTKPAPLGSMGIGDVGFMHETFRQTFMNELWTYKSLFTDNTRHLIQTNRPLADALQFLDLAMSRIHSECFRHGVGAERVGFFVNGLNDAREILGEVIDDLEAEENPTLRPEWNREAKQLWYGEIVCREYRKTAPEQLQILDEFQAREWPRTVPSPWNDEKKLRDTVLHLNDNHTERSLIRFEVFNMKPAWFRFRSRSVSV